MHPPVSFDFDNSYARDLEGFYVAWQGEQAPEPKIIQLNRDLAADLGLDPDALSNEQGAKYFSGALAPEGAQPLAQAYAGHQFGNFSPQLGDGRAMLLGEVLDRGGSRWDLQLKGSGRTPFSRGGDGKAVLGPVLREYLMGEAMHALGIPTTRALAAVTTGDTVMRQEGPQPGAILARIAASHLRVGTFEFFAARKETARVQQLADYAILRHFPELADSENRYLGLLRAVRDRQATLVARWLSVGFVHGVMNTDNTTISGETLDYGPCAFMDSYDPGAVFSSIDRQGRYAYGNQPAITQWNMARLAETLLELIDPEDTDNAVRLATIELDAFPTVYQDAWLATMVAKLGLVESEAGDLDLINDLHGDMNGQNVDFTLVFRRLADGLRGEMDPARALFDEPTALDPWLERWSARLDRQDIDLNTCADAMDRVNPAYIARNHKVEEALQAAAESSDFRPFERLLAVLAQPYERAAGQEAFEGPAPADFGPYTTFCGT